MRVIARNNSAITIKIIRVCYDHFIRGASIKNDNYNNRLTQTAMCMQTPCWHDVTSSNSDRVLSAT